MKITKAFGTMTTLGLLSLCAVSAVASIRIRDDINEIKRTQKRINKQLSEIKTKIESYNNHDGFTTAFRLRLDDTDVSESVEEIMSDSSEFYTVREYNGVIGVFDDEEELIRKIDTSVASLSAADRQSLLLGIKASSETELEDIVESLK